nr:MAG TPA: hypothetical protein [Caudoviricetes sp.]
MNLQNKCSDCKISILSANIVFIKIHWEVSL